MPKKRPHLHWTPCRRYRSVALHRPVAKGKISLSLEAFKFERENIFKKKDNSFFRFISWSLQGVKFTMSKSFILIFIMKRVVFSSAFYYMILIKFWAFKRITTVSSSIWQGWHLITLRFLAREIIRIWTKRKWNYSLISRVHHLITY